MIQVQNISKGFGEQELLREVGFVVNKGERIGLVGRNGSGKTTLFKIILGLEHADAGQIDIPKRYTMGYLQQHLSFSAPTVLQEACSALPVQEGGWTEDWKAQEILGGLGLDEDMQNAPPAQLSGGYQIRLNLAKVLLQAPDLLMLDEPTNYLDVVSVRWLQRFLRQWPGELMIITHDRDFMNSVCTHIVGIHRQKIKKVEGTTSKLYDLILHEEELQAREIANAEKKREQIEVFINRFRAQANRAAAVQSRVKALQKHEMPEKLSNLQNLEFSFSEAAFPGKRMLLVQNLSFGYGDGPDLFSGIEFAVYPGDRIGVIGPNGKGKTTFLNVIGGELQARTGTMNANPNTVQGYFGQTNVQRLHLENTIEGEILSVLPEPLISRARGLAGLMMFEGDAALKPIKVLSGGERARVLLAKILAQPCNLLLLDEPTNHLDMESIDSLVEAVDVFSGAVMVVSHSEQILHALCTRLIVFDGGECTVFDGTYEDFLERKGWSNEGTKKKNTKLAKSTGAKNQKQTTAKADIASNNLAEQGDITKENNKEDRRLRAEKVAQKNKVLKPLKQAAQDLERKIEVLETKLQQAQDELLQASEQGNAEGIQKSSEQIGRIEKERDTVYELYENALLQLEQAQAEWE